MKWLCLGISMSFLAMGTFPKLPTTPSKPLTLQEKRWKDAHVRTSKQSDVRWIARQIKRHKDRYEAIGKPLGIPYWVVASLHNMECGLRFDQNLCNGDPLTRRTRQVPSGRPKTGNPPFSFEYAATDALKYDKMDRVNWKSLNDSLNAFEEYNGIGYRKYHPSVPTPYLWSGSTIYDPPSGKYTSDGKWSSVAVSSQIGIVPILKELGITW